MAVEATAEKWPNFFIVGAARAGTTSLYRYLRDVPGVYMSPVKEPRYFSATLRSLVDSKKIDGRSLNPPLIREKAEYVKLFSKARNEVAVGEATPDYLWDPAAPELIREAVPDARIIISLRDPVERAFSSYLLKVRAGLTRPFEEVADDSVYVVPGLYAEQVKRYFDIFGRERVKILVFEEFTRNVEDAVNDVLTFLGVPGRGPRRLGRAHNAFGIWRGDLVKRIAANRGVRLAARLLPSGVRWTLREILLYKKIPKPPLPDAAAKILAEIYRDDVKALEAILGRSLPWTLAGKR